MTSFRTHGKKKVAGTAKEDTSGKLTENLLALPRVNLNARQLCDLELIANGGFSPLTGFLDEENYTSVVNSMRLTDGSLWPIPVVLDLDEAPYKKGSQILLCDEYGLPLAELTVSSVYQPDVLREAKNVYGTRNPEHPGVQYILNQTGKYYVGGSVRPLRPVERFDFVGYRKSPGELRELFARNTWKNVIGFQTRNPLHRVHVAMMREAAKAYDAHILIHPSVGQTREGDIDYVTRVRSYIALYEKRLKPAATLALLPLAMRMAGPREAIWHALIRKNYGCTHFIVGRDHAGPGLDGAGKAFYGPYQAQELARLYEDETGVSIISFGEMVYVPSKKTYMAAAVVAKGVRKLRISGTKIRSLIRSGKKVPDWASYPEVVAELTRGLWKDRKAGLTIFLTGLPSSGKSTIARMLTARLPEIQEKNVTLLDGDVVRQNLSRGLGFSKKDRDINIRRIGFVAGEVTRHGGIAICAAVAPYREARQANRELIGRLGTYVELYVSTPLSVCQKRDTKGLYRRGKSGAVRAVTGIDDPYEVPIHPELVIDTSTLSPERCVQKIMRYLKIRRLV